MTDTPRDPIAACAEMVQKGDPDRFLATMTGDVEERKRLFPLYAFNLEIARAPYMSQEPMVAMIRLQFWRDVIEAAVEGREAPKHDVATPLSQLVIWGDLRAAPLLTMLEAREGDAQGEPRRDTDQIRAYLRGTSGALMLAAGQATGLTDFEGHYVKDEALEGAGEALGIANWLMSQPALKAAGRGHITPDEGTIRELSETGLAALKHAHTVLGKDGNAALRSAWRTKPILQKALKNPSAAVGGVLGQSEFARRGALLWCILSGRW
ncbi:squalene/phytoene synthase family protein [Aliiroseovarius sp. F47248L]|uniref:squalene/phytoene synthase family protein n=1 Tax=Aliiroseovarius sp. F47248L TaxID=2926420 RepID=UPI001FF1F72D|nr:squalene/phytoene synthase family protein [Aliiroseovarius sp. F47248L]MCK0138889.1 squalene/phytoene synthase family protein [Aliiroseovarius sp. F47248L]